MDSKDTLPKDVTMGSLEEKLSSKLSVIALETASLQEDKVQLSKEVDSLGRQVMALRSRLGKVETATRLKQEQAELYELEEKGERLDSLSRGRRELKTRTLVEKSLVERQTLLREAIRNTRSEGLLLEDQLKSLRHERRTSDCGKSSELPVFPEANVLLGKQRDLEKEHISVICLAAENAAALDASMKRLEKMMERKSEAEAALKLPFCRGAPLLENLNSVASGDESKLKIANNVAASPEALKKLASLSEEVKSREEEVLSSLSSLRALVADDQERLLARQELPSRILDLKAELEYLKQGLAEEKEQFLQSLENEKSKLAEKELSLNIKLAARNMTRERNKVLAIQEEVVLVDDEIEDCPENGGGENCEEENLAKPVSESEGVQVEAGGGEGEQMIQKSSENVEESQVGQVVDEVEKP